MGRFPLDLLVRRSAAVFLGALALAGCGNNSPGGLVKHGSGGTGAGGAAGAGGVGGAAGDGGIAPCSEAPSDIPAGAVCIHNVTGHVIDPSGAPLSGVLASVCSDTTCYPGWSGADGNFSVPVNMHIVKSKTAVLVHERPEKAGFYFPLPDSPGPDLDLGDTPLIPLPEGPQLVVKPNGSPQQSVTAGDVTLDVPQGVQVNLDYDELAAGAKGSEFRAKAVPKNLWKDLVDPALGLSALYAFGPFEAEFVDAQTGKPSLAQMSFKNTAGLPASTPVEFLELGSFLYPTTVPLGTFATVATGTVSADGTTIDMDSGTGIQYITWIGIREKK